MFIAAMEIAFHRPQPILYNDVEFNFHVYCPLSYEPNLTRIVKPLWEYLPFTLQSLVNDPKFNQTYVVNIRTVMTENLNADLKVDQQVQFCGLTRPWNATCADTELLRYTCSNPGPVFDLKTNEEAYVFWINQVNEINVTISTKDPYTSVNSCYQTEEIPNEDEELYPERCWNRIRSPKWQGCTYKDPTDLGENSSTYNSSPIGYNNFPTSTHIHGLEVRPLFDGNPLSWFSKQAKGIGFMSLEEEYFGFITDAEREAIY